MLALRFAVSQGLYTNRCLRDLSMTAVMREWLSYIAKYTKWKKHSFQIKTFMCMALNAIYFYVEIKKNIYTERQWIYYKTHAT
jgi:hypothetical protein